MGDECHLLILIIPLGLNPKSVGNKKNTFLYIILWDFKKNI